MVDDPKNIFSRIEDMMLIFNTERHCGCLWWLNGEFLTQAMSSHGLSLIWIKDVLIELGSNFVLKKLESNFYCMI